MTPGKMEHNTPPECQYLPATTHHVASHKTVMLRVIFSAVRTVRFVHKTLALGRPRRTRVDNVKMDLGNIRWGGIDWIDLAQDRDQ
jgi:hypothetical protein